MLGPEDSMLIARASQSADISLEQRGELTAAAATATSIADLPDWVIAIVQEHESAADVSEDNLDVMPLAHFDCVLGTTPGPWSIAEEMPARLLAERDTSATDAFMKALAIYEGEIRRQAIADVHDALYQKFRQDPPMKPATRENRPATGIAHVPGELQSKEVQSELPNHSQVEDGEPCPNDAPDADDSDASDDDWDCDCDCGCDCGYSESDDPYYRLEGLNKAEIEAIRREERAKFE